MARTVEQIVKEMIAEYVMAIAVLRAENEALKEQLDAIMAKKAEA